MKWPPHSRPLRAQSQPNLSLSEGSHEDLLEFIEGMLEIWPQPPFDERELMIDFIITKECEDNVFIDVDYDRVFQEVLKALAIYIFYRFSRSFSQISLILS